MATLSGTEFSTAHAALPATYPTVRLVILDHNTPAPLQAATKAFFRAVSTSRADLIPPRDLLLVTALSAALPPSPLLSTRDPRALADPRYTRGALARLDRALRVLPPTGGLGAAAAAYVADTLPGATVHLHIAAAAAVFEDGGEARDACASCRVLGDGDAAAFFGDVLGRTLSSRVTLRVGEGALQLVARPRVRAAGVLPPVVGLQTVCRVGIGGLPEDVLFGLPSVVVPDEEAAEDAASMADRACFMDLASLLLARQEAIIAFEKGGPCLVLLPVNATMMLLREIASRETILPCPDVESDERPRGKWFATGGEVDTNPMLERLEMDLPLQLFNPLKLDGEAVVRPANVRFVAFA